MHLGPWLGKKMHGSSEDSIMWNSIGRFITGVITTLLSQPFDTLARQMQKSFKENPMEQPRLLNSIRDIHSEYLNNRNSTYKYSYPAFNGAVPRIGLATFGGVIASGIFDYIKMNFYTDQ
jgi:hypothetical protein